MKITAIRQQAHSDSRANVWVDGAYRFSLDVMQISELGISIGRDYSEADIEALAAEGEFSKAYARALEYCLARPRSIREIDDYLRRKQMTRRIGPGRDVAGISQATAERIRARLLEKGYLSDERFAAYWVENRRLAKGVSLRKLRGELRAKGISSDIIERCLAVSGRTEGDELAKVIRKKQSRYPDPKKFVQYLLRQGFSYDDIKERIGATGSEDG